MSSSRSGVSRPLMHDGFSDGSPPLVTVVTPSFNQAAYLRETIESVLGQDYARVEYIIIDGGSSDGSVGIIREYESQLSYWVSEQDAGQADAINKGWMRARGEIVAYLNSDDTYNPGAVRTAALYLQAHPEVGVAYGDCAWMDDSGQRLGMIQARPFELSDLLLQNRVPQPAAFIRKTALDTVGFLDPTLHWLMDYELWVRIALRYPFAYLPGMLANFRIHATSKTGTSIRHFLREQLDVIARAFENPALPAALARLRPRAVNYAYALNAANAYSLGQSDSGRAILEDFFRDQTDPLAYRQDLIEIFANHALHVAPLGYSAQDPGQEPDEPVQWLSQVMRELPVTAGRLRELEPEMLAQLDLTGAFASWEKGQSAQARGHLWRALKRNPALLTRRGVLPLLARAELQRRDNQRAGRACHGEAR